MTVKRDDGHPPWPIRSGTYREDVQLPADTPQARLIARLKKLDKDATSFVGGSGGRYKCCYCLRDEFPDRDGVPKHYECCEVFVFRQCADELAALRPGDLICRVAVNLLIYAVAFWRGWVNGRRRGS